jgi:hypothetical protein
MSVERISPASSEPGVLSDEERQLVYGCWRGELPPRGGVVHSSRLERDLGSMAGARSATRLCPTGVRQIREPARIDRRRQPWATTTTAS